jgi:hypothetical protein
MEVAPLFILFNNVSYPEPSQVVAVADRAFRLIQDTNVGRMIHDQQSLLPCGPFHPRTRYGPAHSCGGLMCRPEIAALSRHYFRPT